MKSTAYVFFPKQMQDCQSELHHSWKVVLIVLVHSCAQSMLIFLLS